MQSDSLLQIYQSSSAKAFISEMLGAAIIQAQSSRSGMSNISQSIIGWLLVGTSSIQPQRSGSPIHAKNGLRSPDVGASLEFWSGSPTLNVQRIMGRVA